jgi:type II secretory pathway predicted ATPase ExeA
MNGLTTPFDPQTALKTLWGASEMPLGEAVSTPVLAATFKDPSHRLEQLVAVRACGLIHGPNGVGKTLLVEQLMRTLPEKRFKSILISHASVTATDLIRLLCAELGVKPRMRRSDNLREIRSAWQQLDRLWPVIVLDEAQDLSASALEELRLLSCDRRDSHAPFSLLLVGDEQLLPRLQMGINAPLLARLSFCLHLPLWTAADLNAYLEARLQQAGIHANPFDSSAQQLLIQVANGLPRRLNQVAQRAMQQALEQNSRAITVAHIHSALELMPWVAKL